MLLSHRPTGFGGLADDLAFDVVEFPDPVEGLAGNVGPGCLSDIVEVAP
ncbi:hypothetical protein SAMN05444006_10294 [Allgaiera indica]|uniref:Uncharacterized protein n=1 Tax=Allgaiera indica TaxID=765699 RepID=A0A1H2RPA6_9RHOB|nr:hypothetical protein SAMN05444006_10294 [Allgaiera indica]